MFGFKDTVLGHHQSLRCISSSNATIDCLTVQMTGKNNPVYYGDFTVLLKTKLAGAIITSRYVLGHLIISTVRRTKQNKLISAQSKILDSLLHTIAVHIFVGSKLKVAPQVFLKCG